MIKKINHKLKGYRTILINLLPIVIGLIDYIVANGETVKLMIHDPMMVTFIIVAGNMINIILRFLTSGPVGKQNEC